MISLVFSAYKDHAVNGIKLYSYLTHCILGIFFAFLSSVDFCFVNLTFERKYNHSRIPSECQTVWTQIRPDKYKLSGPDQGPNCFLGYQQTTRVDKEIRRNTHASKIAMTCLSASRENLPTSYSINMDTGQLLN